MLDWLFDLLSGKTLVKFGFDCWNSLSGVAMTLLGSTPAQVADGTLWNVSMNLVTVMKIVGASLFNLLFFIFLYVFLCNFFILRILFFCASFRCISISEKVSGTGLYSPALLYKIRVAFL